MIKTELKKAATKLLLVVDQQASSCSTWRGDYFSKYPIVHFRASASWSGQRTSPSEPRSNMAAVMRNLRCERFYLFLRLFNESGISLSQRFTLRSTFSTSTSKLYSKTLPFLAKKWEAAGTTDHDFARPRTSGRDDLKTRSRSNNRNYSNEEDDSESDSESEDEEDVGRKSGKLKQKTGKAAAKIPKLSQKSGHTKSLRPSKYLFRDRRGWNEEKQWEGRQIPEDSKGKAGWYARQMSRLIHEDKVRDKNRNLAHSHGFLLQTKCSPADKTLGQHFLNEWKAIMM